VICWQGCEKDGLYYGIVQDYNKNDSRSASVQFKNNRSHGVYINFVYGN
jgi:hypothetical protein